MANDVRGFIRKSKFRVVQPYYIQGYNEIVSQRVATDYNSQQRRCFWNVAAAIRDKAAYLQPTFDKFKVYYVEGLAALNDLPGIHVEHGWLEVEFDWFLISNYHELILNPNKLRNFIRMAEAGASRFQDSYKHMLHEYGIDRLEKAALGFRPGCRQVIDPTFSISKTKATYFPLYRWDITEIADIDESYYPLRGNLPGFGWNEVKHVLQAVNMYTVRQIENTNPENGSELLKIYGDAGLLPLTSNYEAESAVDLFSNYNDFWEREVNS